MFYIYSISGRKLDNYSELGEKEVLFAPASQFMVCNIIHKQDKIYVSMREVNIGSEDKVMLWIQDNLHLSLDSKSKDTLDIPE